MPAQDGRGPIGIVGVGLLGGSIALRAKAVWPDVEIIGVDHSAAHLEVALARGAIDRVERELDILVTQCRTVVLATPAMCIEEDLIRLARIAAHATPWPELILDIASVKRRIAEIGAAVPRFIATHPMAGWHTEGPSYADAALFEARPWAIVPSRDEHALRAARAFVDAMGARAVEVTAERHDRIVARSSHLPQALSTMLAGYALREKLEGLWGRGLEDMLRIAQSPESVWRDIFARNGDVIADELDGFARELTAFAARVRAGEASAVASAFDDAHTALDANGLTA